MFKKRRVKTSKTNENAQFYVGAAVGITVGLCVGKLLSSPTTNKTDISRELTDNVLKNDNVSINKHKSIDVRSKSASRYEDGSVEDATLKTISSDSKINNIDSSSSTKMQSDDKMLSFGESCQITEDTIVNDSTFKLGEQGIERVDNTVERTSIDYPLDNVSENISLSNETNKATCNTNADVNLTSAQDDLDSFDAEYDEFGNFSLLSSTKDSILF